MISPTRVLEVKAKGDACNRCRLRRVRCTGVNGEPCAACTRTARFRNHDLDDLYCGYHGSRPCSEESEDRVRPRKKRNRSGSDSLPSSSSGNKSTASSPSGKARSSTSKKVLRKRLPSSRQSPSKTSWGNTASTDEVVPSLNEVEAATAIKREPIEPPTKVESICTSAPAPEASSSLVASTSHLPDLPEPEPASMHVDDAPGPVQTLPSLPMDESSPIDEVFTVSYEYPALEDVFQDPRPAIPSSIDTFPHPSYFEPLSPPFSSRSSFSSMSASPLSSAYSSCASCASPCASLMLTPDAVPDAFYLGDACIVPSLVGTMTSMATAAATTESTFSGLLAAVTTTPYWFPEETVVTPCFEDCWPQWSPISDPKTFQGYPSPFLS